MVFVIRIGAEMPNFDCNTTKGDFKFHDFLKGDEARPWTLLFTHPKVCFFVECSE